MRTRRNAYVLAAAALLWAGTAAAGTVYLPLAVNGALGGKTYKTYVWITNASGGPHEVEVRYIPRDTVGLPAAGGATVTSRLSVGPGQTFRLAVGEAGVGMVEIDGPDDAVYAARLESLTPGGLVRSQAHLPLIGAEDVFAPGDKAHVQGVERATGSASHFGIATFGAEDGECSLTTFRADGSRILSTATVWAPAVGQRFFQDVFNMLQVPSVADARVEVSCDVPFYPFSAILASEPDSTQFVLPSTTGADDLGPAAPGPRDGELVRMDGTFFRPVPGASIMDIELPIEAGVQYTQITWEFDVIVPNIRITPGTNFLSTTLLLRPVRGGTHFAHTIRVNGRNKSTIDLGDHQVVRGPDAAWAVNTLHHVRVDYDTAARRMVWELSRNGQMVEQLVGNIGTRDLTHHGEGLHILFGLDKAYDHGAYLPPLDFAFSDLVVTGVPAQQ